MRTIILKLIGLPNSGESGLVLSNNETGCFVFYIKLVILFKTFKKKD